MKNEWITRAEAAKTLRVSTITIDTYIRRGMLQATKLGKKGGRAPVRIASASVERLLNGGESSR